MVIASGADADTRREMEDTARRLGLRVLGFLSKPVSLDALLTLFAHGHGSRVGRAGRRGEPVAGTRPATSQFTKRIGTQYRL